MNFVAVYSLLIILDTLSIISQNAIMAMIIYVNLHTSNRILKSQSVGPWLLLILIKFDRTCPDIRIPIQLKKRFVLLILSNHCSY